jgi:NAD(P)H-dependent flavin oxidoreductase YrpB (nitropropane dioxygenase family)
MGSPSNVSTTAFQTSLCKLMGIRYPIVQAGMSGFTVPNLVAEVFNGVGLGIFGHLSYAYNSTSASNNFN